MTHKAVKKIHNKSYFVAKKHLSPNLKSRLENKVVEEDATRSSRL